MELAIAALVGVLLGGIGIWLLLSGRIKTAEAKVLEGENLKSDLARLEERAKRMDEVQTKLDTALGDLSRLASQEAELKARHEEDQKRISEQRELLNEAEEKLSNTFEALSSKTLKASTEEFLKQAERIFKAQTESAEGDLKKRQESIDNLVKPLQEKLKEYEEHLQQMRRDSEKLSGQQGETLKQLFEELKDQRALAKDIQNVLKGGTQRGRIGEQHFQVVLERAGLLRGQHYEMQKDIGEGRRPDCLIFLPDSGRVVVDIKTPMNAFQDAMESDDEAFRNSKLDEHVKVLRRTIDDLSRKDYAREDGSTPMVIMYLPIEAAYSVALSRDPQITSYGWDKQVMIATPTLLFALVKGLAVAWQQQQIQEKSKDIVALGREMLDRVRVVAEHMQRVGTGLNTAVGAYNKAVTSMDRNLYTTARRFESLGVTLDKERPALVEAKDTDEEFRKPELLEPLADNEKKALEAANDQLLFEIEGGTDEDAP